MSLVLDAWLTLSWYFADERTPGADRVLDLVAEHGAVVPGLWRLEVANGLQMAMRRRRVDAAYRDEALAQLARLRIEVDTETDHHAWSGTVRLADRFQLTLYDAAYLELAHRRRVALATLDVALRDAAAALAVGLLGGAGDAAPDAVKP